MFLVGYYRPNRTHGLYQATPEQLAEEAEYLLSQQDQHARLCGAHIACVMSNTLMETEGHA